MSKSVKGDPKIDKDFIKLADGITEAVKPRRIRNLDLSTLLKGKRALGHAMVEIDDYIETRKKQSAGGTKGAAKKRDIKRAPKSKATSPRRRRRRSTAKA